MTEEYRKFVDEVLHPWLKQNVSHGEFVSDDGLKISCYWAINPEEKASIVMVHGFCEFFGKFHETAYRFFQEGYSVFFIELRGFGLSERTIPFEDQRVIVDSFDEYLNDVHIFVTEIVSEMSRTGKLFLYGHSMGGLISALYLEDHPEVFRCAVLSSPMIEMRTGKFPKPAIGILSMAIGAAGKDTDYAAGQHEWRGEYQWETSSAMDQDRYEYQFNMRNNNPHYQTWGGTWAWARAASHATDVVFINEQNLETHVLICQAGADTMVDNSGQNKFAERSRLVTLITFPEAKHELYNARDDIRENYYRAVFDYYRAFL